jgi:hypothetical protein
MTQHQSERDHCRRQIANRHLHFDQSCFMIHDQEYDLTDRRTPWGVTRPGVKEGQTGGPPLERVGEPGVEPAARRWELSPILLQGQPVGWTVVKLT